jgi:hypothetical protein
MKVSVVFLFVQPVVSGVQDAGVHAVDLGGDIQAENRHLCHSGLLQ